MSETMMPCPWCEKNDMIAVEYAHYFYEVHCNRCLKAVSGDGTRASAISAWNALPRTVQAAPSDTSADDPYFRAVEAIREILGCGHAPLTMELVEIVRRRVGLGDAAQKMVFASSDRERALEFACKEVLATPSFGALRSADAVDTIKMVRAALAAAPDKPQYAALSPEPWGGPEGEEDA